MMKKMISVIVPVYNVEQYLEKCLESLLAQTYKELEIILVDDGSTDDSGKICDSYAEKDERIKVLHCKNGGLSAARNKGIEAAQGEYLSFIDSDDIVAENMIEYLLGLLKKESDKLAICDICHCYPDKNNIFEQSSEVIKLNNEAAICELWYQKSFLPSACGKLYKRELFQNIAFPEGMIFEDIAVMHKLFWKAETIVYGKSKLYGYMHRENSITTKTFQRKNLDILKVCSIQKKFVEGKSLQLQEAARAYQMVGCFRIYLNAPHTEEYKDIIKKCQKTIDRNWHLVYRDRNIRKKLRISLILYRYFRPFMKMVYRRVDRWK